MNFLDNLFKKQQYSPELDDQSDDSDNFADKVLAGVQPVDPEQDKIDAYNAQIKRLNTPSPADRGDAPALDPADMADAAQDRASAQLAARPTPAKITNDDIDAQIEALKSTAYATNSKVDQSKIDALNAQKIDPNLVSKPQARNIAQAMPELTSDPSMPKQGMGDSLVQRSGDDIPKPVDPGTDLNEPNDLDSIEDSLDASPDSSAKTTAKPVDSQLLDAQNRSNNLAALMLMTKGAEKIGAGLSRTKSDPNFNNELQPLINRPVEDVLTQRDQSFKAIALKNAQEKEDPHSPISQITLQTTKAMIQNSPTLSKNQKLVDLVSKDNVSASDIEKFSPMLFNLVSAEEARQARMAMAQAMSQQKGEKVNDKLRDSLKKDLDPNQARAGNMATSQKMVNNADRVDALFQQFPDYNIPKTQTNELSGALAGLINGGSAQSQHQINTLTPSSLGGDVNAIAGWVTNNPTGLQQQRFLRQMHETALRERGVAQNQVTLAKIQRLPAYGKLAKNDPDGYEAELIGAGLDPKDFDSRGLYIGNDPSILQGYKNMQGKGRKTLNDGGPAAATNAAAQGSVVIREKATGRMKQVSADKAKQILNDPKSGMNYEQVQ